MEGGILEEIVIFCHYEELFLELSFIARFKDILVVKN